MEEAGSIAKELGEGRVGKTCEGIRVSVALELGACWMVFSTPMEVDEYHPGFDLGHAAKGP